MPTIKENDISTAIIANNALFILGSVLHCKIFHASLTVSQFHSIYLSLDITK